MRTPEWYARARCRTERTGLFYDDGWTWAAKCICADCPVRQECYDYAYANEEFGTWGGATEDERAQARKRNGDVPLSDLQRYDIRHLGIGITSLPRPPESAYKPKRLP